MAVSKILVAHDFSDAADRALRYASEFGRQAGARLAVAYVLPDVEGRADGTLTIPGGQAGQGERYLHFLQQELEKAIALRTSRRAGEVEIHVARGDPVRRIEQLAEQLGADLVCVGATGNGAAQRALLGSVSQLVLRSSLIPVLIVP